MKSKISSLIAMSVLITATWMVFKSLNQNQPADPIGYPGPSLLPTLRLIPTVEPYATSVPRAEPLRTQEQVLEYVSSWDMARWEKPWSLETLKTDPERITLEVFPNRSAEGGGVFLSEVEAINPGPVWRITIRGKTKLSLGGLAYNPDAEYGGVVYVVSQRSGHLLSISALPIVPTEK